MLLVLMASSKLIMTICGTCFESNLPGISVPDSEQKQSGSRQTDGSQGGALFGSEFKSADPQGNKLKMNFNF